MKVPSHKYFNTWNTKSPAIMEFLPAEFGICPGFYSDSKGGYTGLPFGENMRLLEHHRDGNYCRLIAKFAGTEMQIEYAKVDDYTVLCNLTTLSNGEWGLRFLVTVAFGFFGEKGEMDGYTGTYRSYKTAVAFQDQPIRTAYTSGPDDEGYKMQEQGYYAPEIEVEHPKFAVAKFNLELTPQIKFAVCVANDEKIARARAQQALARDMQELRALALADGPSESGEYACAMEAIRDVMAWNAVYDRINGRPITSITRYWIDRKFGGWFVWLDDLFYHALISLVSGDLDMARYDLVAALANSCPEGNFACLMSEYTEWVDRSQPPICAFIVYKYYLFTGDLTLLTRAYHVLKKSLKWWQENRRTQGGLFAYGSSQIGHGHFVGTKLAAKDESSMDNSPMYDSAVYDEQTGMMDMHDIALNSLLVIEAENIGHMAKVFGDDPAPYYEFAGELSGKIDEQLYDEKRQIYANRKLSGEFAPVSPTSFYPLLAGIPDQERRQQLAQHMFNEEEFYTYAPFPSICATEKSVQDGSYWRGRMWAPLNFLTHAGLKRMGMDEEAYRLAKRSIEIFEPGWVNENACYENYNTFTGEGRGKDADPYYGWGALIPLMWILEHMDVDPENGFHIAASAQSKFRIENLLVRGRRFTYEVNEHDCSLYMGNFRVISATTASGRIRHIVVERHYIGFVVDAQTFKGADVFLPEVDAKMVLLNGQPCDPGAKSFKMPAGESVKAQIWF